MQNERIICPVCGLEEFGGSILCSGCGVDLTTISPPLVTSASVMSSTGLVVSEQVRFELRRCVECQTDNEAWAALCSGCGRELDSGALQPSATPAIPRLRLRIGESEFACSPGDVLGREGTVAGDAMLPFETVHRRHAQLNFEQGQWFIMALASARNLTELDGKRLARSQMLALTGKHQVRLSTRCHFSLEVEPVEAPELTVMK